MLESVKRLAQWLLAARQHSLTFFVGIFRAEDRQRLGQLAAVLKDAPEYFERGGLPTLTQHLEPGRRLALDTTSLPQALAQADALAAVSVNSSFRACLRRASLRYYVLRAAGQPAVFVVGAQRARQPTVLDGHAWVEINGQSFREDPQLIAKMVVMYCLVRSYLLRA